MKLALITHGWIRLPGSGRDLDAISIGLWNYRLALRLAARGHDVTVYCEEPSRILGFREEQHGGVHFRHVGTRGDGRILRLAGRLRPHAPPDRPLFATRAAMWRYCRGVARAIARDRPDLALVSNFPQVASAIKRRSPGTRVWLHMQCEWLSQLDSDLVRRHAGTCDLLSGCSAFVADRIAGRLPELASRTFPLLSGVDTDDFHPDGSHRAGRELLFVGRRSPEKGIHVLIEAFRRIADEFPDVRLRLVGADGAAPFEYIAALDDDPLVQEVARFYGRDDYRRYLDSLIPDDLASRVVFQDHVSQSLLDGIYSASAAFVFPSLWNEPFGLPILEAMAAGVPVVSTFSGGIPEFVEPMRTGLLVERGDADALAEALRRVLGDAELRGRLVRNAHQTIRERWTWDHVAANVEKALRPA